MPAAITDKFTEATSGSRPVPASLTATRAVSAASISCDALTGWPTATAVHFIIYSVNVNGAKVAGSQTDWKGIVSGTSITDLVLKAGTDNGDSIGAIVEAAPTAAWADDLTEGILVSHDQDGTLRAGAVDVTSVIADGVITPAKLTTALQGDWKSGLLPAVSSVTNNGNRSADITFASTVASILTPGMRVRTSRTVAAPTQCTDLESGSSQYFSSASAGLAGMTFTDDFTCSAWIKLESYTAGGIISRWNGTSGFLFYVNASGQLVVQGTGAAANELGTSYQSVPLNKWVHVAGTLDMSGGASTMYFDGVSVPVAFTSPGGGTALTQAGDLQIGAYNGTTFFDGKIAQVAVFSSILSASTIRSYMSQGLAGTESTLVSAFSCSNSLLDLNTTNNNDLTANGGALMTNADSPFTLDANGVAAGTYDWGIVTKVATTVATVQYPEGCAIPTSGGISTVDYSGVKAPFGMPVDENRWSLLTLNRALNTQASAVVSTWYNIGSFYLTIPIGVWRLSALIPAVNNQAATGGINIYTTLSTSSSSESDRNFSVGNNVNASSCSQISYSSQVGGQITATAQTPYYGNIRTTNGTSITLYLDGATTGAVLAAVPAYL